MHLLGLKVKKILEKNKKFTINDGKALFGQIKF